MKFKQWTNVANILDYIFNQRDSLIRSKVSGLDYPNYFKVKVKKPYKPTNFQNIEHN